MSEFELRVGDAVAAALSADRPVVALESTIFSLGLPRPRNLEVALEVEALIREEGAVPATVGMIEGRPTVGLTEAEIERLATADDVRKLSARDLPVAMAAGIDGATTVAATAALAVRAGVAVFATGGLGGVHRQASATFDESADLVALARIPIAVVCSGVKSILDVRATLERLETLGVTVLGFGTQRFAGFYLTDSGEPVDWSVETPQEVAAVLRAGERLGLPPHATVIAHPLPVDEQIPPLVHDRALQAGLEAAARQGLRGKDVTPFLLDFLHTTTKGQTTDANVHLIRRNAVLAARIAGALVA